MVTSPDSLLLYSVSQPGPGITAPYTFHAMDVSQEAHQEALLPIGGKMGEFSWKEAWEGHSAIQPVPACHPGRTSGPWTETAEEGGGPVEEGRDLCHFSGQEESD